MFTHFKTQEGWLAFMLLFLLLFTVTLSLQAAQWAPGLNLLFGVFLMAFTVGILFAKSHLSGLLTHPLAFIIGLLWIGYRSLPLIPQDKWEAQLVELIVRLIKWYRLFASERTSTDTLPFVILMATLIWLITYSSLWYYYRERNIWGVLLPSGVTILINTYYANKALTFLLLFYLILAFLLVIRTNLLEQERRWQESRIFYTSDIQLDFFRQGTFFALLVLLFAWLLPSAISNANTSPFYAQLSQPWERAQQEWNRMFSALNYNRANVSGNIFGTSMSFHGPLNRGDGLVMTIQVDQPHYWRAVVMDDYTSAGWALSGRKMGPSFEPNQPLFAEKAIAALAGRAIIKQTISFKSPSGGLLFTAGVPLQVDRGSQSLLGGPTAANGWLTTDSFAQLYAQKTIPQEEATTLLSAIPHIEPKSLRQSDQNYPAWIKEHYTKLPKSLPQRVLNLGTTLTAQTDNPYDAAKAIESYLRTIPYSENIPGPRPGEDGVDYFLFREQQGYCDYYASAMAVISRSQGIPARLVQGYSQGELVADGLYQIKQKDAHTWVELYFPPYGWIEFEPTAAQPTLSPAADNQAQAIPSPSVVPPNSQNDPLSEEERLLQNNPPLPKSPSPTSISIPNIFDERVLALILLPIGLVSLIALILFIFIRIRWQGLSPIERLYDQFCLINRAIGQPPDPTLTPYEYTQQIGRQIPSLLGSIKTLATLYNKARFAQPATSLTESEKQQAKKAWAEIRAALLVQFVRRLI